MNQQSNTVDLLTRQLQAMWSGDKRAAQWVTDYSIDSVASLQDPLPFYLVEPLVTERTCLSFTEVEDARRLSNRLRKEPLSFSHGDLGNCAMHLALDLLWQRSQHHELANSALMSCLANFCLFETGFRILNEAPPPGHLRFGGLLFYARKKFRGAGEVTCRPFAGHTPTPFSEDDLLSFSADLMEIDARNHPDMRKRFPVNKFLRKYLQ